MSFLFFFATSLQRAYMTWASLTLFSFSFTLAPPSFPHHPRNPSSLIPKELRAHSLLRPPFLYAPPSLPPACKPHPSHLPLHNNITKKKMEYPQQSQPITAVRVISAANGNPGPLGLFAFAVTTSKIKFLNCLPAPRRAIAHPV